MTGVQTCALPIYIALNTVTTHPFYPSTHPRLPPPPRSIHRFTKFSNGSAINFHLNHFFDEVVMDADAKVGNVEEVEEVEKVEEVEDVEVIEKVEEIENVEDVENVDEVEKVSHNSVHDRALA